MNARVPAVVAGVSVCAPWQVALGRALRVRVTTVPVASPAPGIEGWMASGIVEATGPNVTLYRPANWVCYAVPGTSACIAASLHLVDERVATRHPFHL